MSLDEKYEPVSLYSDQIWDFTHWAGTSFKLNFTGGQKGSRAELIDAENARLLQLVMVWLIWGKYASNSPRTLQYQFSTIRPLFALASKHGIRADQLMQFPRVLEALNQRLGDSKIENLPLLLHRLWDSREELGFVIVDSTAIQSLSNVDSKHHRKQTPYIPPRIWIYQVQRLKECLDDYMAHKGAIEDCFNYCVDLYANVHGSLEVAMESKNNSCPTKRPFSTQRDGAHIDELAYPGRFEITVEQYGLARLLEKWIGTSPKGGRDVGVAVSDFSQYLTLCQRVAYAYVLNFTAQRKEEAASLRADCLIWEQDPLGAIPMICGETTKTVGDSDARWPTSPTVSLAIDVATSVARLRMRCAAAHPNVRPTEMDRENPYLFHRVFEPFGTATDRSTRYTTLPQQTNYQRLMKYYPRLFDAEQLRITTDDRRAALMFTGWIEFDENFSVGKIWPLAWHQLRRTTAVNLFASEVVSDESIQFLMKHSTQTMSRYYGRGRGRLRISELATNLVISSMYEVKAETSKLLSTDRYVSPHGFERKEGALVNLIDKKDAKSFAKAGAQGQIFFRLIRLGACTSQGDCEYGGIESVAHCGGGDTGKPCADALFDREKEGTVLDEMRELSHEIEAAAEGTPKHRALVAERTAMENYLNVLADFA